MPVAHLEGAVAGPHQAAGAEIFEDAAEERLEVRIWGGLFAKGVEGGGLHFDERLASERGEEADVGIANGAVGTDAGEMVDDDRSGGILTAHTVERRESVRTEQGTNCQVFRRGGAPHSVDTGGVGAADDAEAPDALGGQRFHGLPGVGSIAIDYADAAEDAGVGAHAVEHVGVIEAIEAHLNEHDLLYASGLGMGEQVRRGEAGRRVVALPGGAGVADLVVGPNMNVGVDDGRHGADPSILFGC